MSSPQRAVDQWGTSSFRSVALTGDGITADTTVEKGKAVAAPVLPKLM